jgi:hypothetical protein
MSLALQYLRRLDVNTIPLLQRSRVRCGLRLVSLTVRRHPLLGFVQYNAVAPRSIVNRSLVPGQHPRLACKMTQSTKRVDSPICTADSQCYIGLRWSCLPDWIFWSMPTDLLALSYKRRISAMRSVLVFLRPSTSRQLPNCVSTTI